MKVLLINGSPKKKGNTFLALSEVVSALEACGIGSDIVWIGNKAVQGCIACNKCSESDRCVFQDELYKSGFTNRSSFYRVFSKKYGCTPSEYRQQHVVKK